MDLQHWVNDGLMVFFFFLIGMEVRRELSMGELVQRSRLTVPAIAAIAGLVLPALIYLAINAGGEGAVGWGIPMATDTAFLLGALAIFGRSCPIQLRVFLLSLSVVDDIGALSARSRSSTPTRSTWSPSASPASASSRSWRCPGCGCGAGRPTSPSAR